MRNYIKILTLLLLFFSCSLKTEFSYLIQKKWNGGIAFDGPDIFELKFFRNKFGIRYGENIYTQFDRYKITGDTLIILRKDGNSKYNPLFLINNLTEDKLEITALNFPAVFITNSISSPYQQGIDETQYWNDTITDISRGNVLNTKIRLKN